MCRTPRRAHCRNNGRFGRHGVGLSLLSLSLSSEFHREVPTDANTLSSMLLQQNARVTAASLLPALAHLPPTMVLPGMRLGGTLPNGDDAAKEDVVGSKTA